MDDLNDLKEIWHAADTSALPGATEMMHSISRYRNNKLVKKAALILAAILLTATMVAVVFLYKSAMVSTRIGEACIITAGLILITTNIGSIGRLYKVKDLSNKEFLGYLGQIKINRLYYYRKTQVAGLLFASVGLLFYLYEGVHLYPWVCIVSYTVLIIYLLIMSLVVRPRMYRRQARKLEETTKEMKRLADQF